VLSNKFTREGVYTSDVAIDTLNALQAIVTALQSRRGGDTVTVTICPDTERSEIGYKFTPEHSLILVPENLLNSLTLGELIDSTLKVYFQHVVLDSPLTEELLLQPHAQTIKDYGFSPYSLKNPLIPRHLKGGIYNLVNEEGEVFDVSYTGYKNPNALERYDLGFYPEGMPHLVGKVKWVQVKNQHGKIKKSESVDLSDLPDLA